MSCVAQNHFPMIRWQEGAKYLWNPVHRKVLKNRPEERVRLRIIEYLLEAGWSRYRITTEETVKGLERESGLRTDIICYNQAFDPRILVECKAESVPISGKTAEQIARYNQHVQAPYLLLSNGYQDYWYGIDVSDHSVQSLPGPPGILNRPEEIPEREFDYWSRRGFAGVKAKPPLRRWLEDALKHFSLSAGNKKYLQFKQSPEDLDLNHYYQIIELATCKVAYAFMDTPYGGSRLIGIINQNGENRAVVEVNMDLMFEEERLNTSIYSREGIKNIDIHTVTDRLKQDPDDNLCSEIPGFFQEVFEMHFH